MTVKKSTGGKTLWFFILSILLLALLVLFNLFSPRNTPPELQAVLRVQPIALKPFTLTDQDGKPFSLEQLKGKRTLLFFGYMSCPDICPTTLATLNHVYKKLGAIPGARADLQVVFVSVDPKRDRPEKLAEYIHYFNQRFIALTGSKEAIDKFTRQFSAGYVPDKKQADGNYLISHTSSIFLIDPEANLIATFSPPHKANTLVSQYLQIKNM